MRKIRWIAISIAVILMLVISYWELKADVKEKYRIVGLETHIFKIIDEDTDVNCYALTGLTGSISSEDILLIGIKFKIDYLSVKREHFFDVTNFPEGYSGNIDSIVKMQMVLLNDQFEIGQELQSAIPFTNFHINNMRLIGNEMVSGNCYLAKTFPTLSDFVSKYNSMSSPYPLREINDYHFFCFPRSLIKGSLVKKSKQ